MYKLKQLVPRKYIYKIEDLDKNTFLNRMYFIRKTANKSNVVYGSKLNKKYNATIDSMYKFYDWCNDQSVDPMNFITKDKDKSNYELTTHKELFNVEININDLGLHWKHLVEENVSNLDMLDIYNFSLEGDILKYTYLYKDFLSEYKNQGKVNHINFIEDDRKTEYKLRDYLSLDFYDFPVKLEKELYNENNKNLYNFKLSTENNMASQVFQDFYYFLDKNKVECPKCNRLVDNAFEDYMIQFYRHDGC